MMVAEVRCPNPTCGRPSRLGADALGRTFRCTRCGTKLPRAAAAGASERTPWEEEERAREAETPGRPLGFVLPARLGRFQVRGLLGAGSHATVYRAFDPDLEREVALKVPHAGSPPGSRELARFQAEARALARLRHPGVVAVYESGHCGDRLYLATAFIDGRTLGVVLDDGPMEYARAAAVAAELADALGYAHGLGVVHRDVKPANVMIETTGSVHLTDFGLALRSGADEAPRDGVLSGTPAYLAPELTTTDGTRAAPASDQYSLGVVLYEMLCGRAPFVGPPALVLYSARFDDPLPPHQVRPGVPRGLERICLKAMARRPGDRYPDCRALAEDLRGWLAGAGRGRRPARRRASLARAVGWVGRRPAAAVSTLLAVLGLAASAVLATALVAPLDPAPSPAEAPHDGAVPVPLLAGVERR